jgi:hypothetical protein
VEVYFALAGLCSLKKSLYRQYATVPVACAVRTLSLGLSMSFPRAQHTPYNKTRFATPPQGGRRAAGLIFNVQRVR